MENLSSIHCSIYAVYVVPKIDYCTGTVWSVSLWVNTCANGRKPVSHVDSLDSNNFKKLNQISVIISHARLRWVYIFRFLKARSQ